MNDLFIGGGGYNGILLVGALEYLHSNDYLDVKNFYGTSIGSLIGLLYICGNSPREILNYFMGINLKTLIKYDFNNSLDSKCILNSDLFDTLLSFLPDNLITIGDFKNKYNVNIHIHVTNITKNEYECFSNFTHPDEKIRDVIKASMSIPGLFKPVEINGNLYLDGCLKNIYGCPSNDIYIKGYSLIISDTDNSNYLVNIIKSAINNDLPRSLYILKFKNNEDSKTTYFNLDKINNKFTKRLYLKGIKDCMEQIV